MAVSFSDLEAAFDFVNFGGDGENEAVLDRRTGKIYCRSFFSGETDEGFPDEASQDSDEKYVAIPGRRDLDLGKTLVLDFARQVMSEGDYDEVRSIFNRKGAYARFKNLLARRRLLDSWHEFSDKAEKAALRDWAAENGVELTD